MIEFFVPGIPVAKGSAKAFFNKKTKRAFVTQDNLARQKPWVSLISLKAEQAGVPLCDGPVELEMIFRMPRPKAHFNKKGLKDNAPNWHVSTPDIDKLQRAVLDALTAILYHDDRQVCNVRAIKQYALTPGLWLRIFP